MKKKMKMKYQVMLCYLPHRSRDFVSPCAGFFYSKVNIIGEDKEYVHFICIKISNWSLKRNILGKIIGPNK